MAQLASVIIPCFNHGKYVAEAIESCLRQTHAPLEVVVVDDGSTDHSAEVVRRYPTVKYLHQKNAGPSAARNHGTAESRGDFLCFMDADDRLPPGAVERHISHLEATGAGWSYGGSVLIDDAGVPVGLGENPQYSGDAYHVFRAGNWVQPGRVMVRRSSLSTVGGFDLSLCGAADWDMWLRLARRFPVAALDEPVLEYRLALGSMSSNSLKMMADCLRVVQKHRRAHPGCGECQKIQSRMTKELAAACKLSAWKAQSAGDHVAARAWYALAAQFDLRVLLDLSTIKDLAAILRERVRWAGQRT